MGSAQDMLYMSSTHTNKTSENVADIVKALNPGVKAFNQYIYFDIAINTVLKLYFNVRLLSLKKI